MRECLVIVDMQWEFLKNLTNINETNKLIENICKKINYFKKNNLPIVVLEYYISDNISNITHLYTAKKIINNLIDYELLFYATKENDGGGREVIQSMMGEKYKHMYDENYQNKFSAKKNININLDESWNFIITGVNASACVLDTAIDLHKMGHKVSIPMFCSYDTFTEEWAYEIDVFQEEEVKKVVQLVV